MSVETTSQTMRSYLDALLARGEFADSFTDDITWTTVGTGQELQGRQPVRDFISWMHTQAFDAHPKVKTLVVGDGQAALEADFVGTHTGEFLGIPATGKSVQVPYCGLRPARRRNCRRSLLHAHGPVHPTAQVMGWRRSPGSWSALAHTFEGLDQPGGAARSAASYGRLGVTRSILPCWMRYVRSVVERSASTAGRAGSGTAG